MSAYTDLTAFKVAISTATTKPTLDLKQERDLGAANSLPAAYVVAFVTSRSIDQPARMNGTFDPRGYRLTTRVMAKESIISGYELERLVRVAFAPPAQVDLGGVPVDVRYETGGGDFAVDDAGYFYASTDYIYVR